MVEGGRLVKFKEGGQARRIVGTSFHLVTQKKRIEKKN